MNFPDVTLNFVPSDPFFETPVGKGLRWALSVGRYVVIFTELVVILSFVARFTLDRQITDLNESINQKRTIIQSYGNIERDVRVYQTKIEQYQQVQQQVNIADVFATISRITPNGVSLQQLRIEQDEVTFSGISQSQDTLNTLLSNLTLSNTFSQVDVPQIGNAEEQEGLAFSVNASLNLEELTASPALEDDGTVQGATTTNTTTATPSAGGTDG